MYSLSEKPLKVIQIILLYLMVGIGKVLVFLCDMNDFVSLMVSHLYVNRNVNQMITFKKDGFF